MSSTSYITDSLTSLVQSGSIIRSLAFKRTQIFSLAVLSPESYFETHLIRDAEPHELSLFRPSDNRYDPIDALEEEKWVATKRKGPERVGMSEKASPLKDPMPMGGRKGEDPERCLRAAKKLLRVYPMRRATEHVDALMLQFEGLQSSIAELEEELKQPLPSRINQHVMQDQESRRATELSDAIRKEEMEIFALEHMLAEKKHEVPVPKPRIVKKPAPPPQGASNPFGKSTILEQKAQSQALAHSKPRLSVATAPLNSPDRTKVPAPISPVTTPKAVRTVPGLAGKAKSPVKIMTPTKPPAKEEEVTPKAVRTPRVPTTGSVAGVAKRKGAVTDEELDIVAAKVWSGVGDALRPWARKTLIRDGEEIPSPLTTLSFSNTMKTLATILSAPPSTSTSTTNPTSPGSVASTFLSLTSEEEDLDPTPPPSGLLLEFELLNLLLSTLASRNPVPSAGYDRSATSLPELAVTMRDAILASSLVSPSSSSSSSTSKPLSGTGTGKKQEPMVSMNHLKLHLAQFANERNWEDGNGMGTTAIYGLVSKAVLRIDRRGKEGPMLGFRA